MERQGAIAEVIGEVLGGFQKGLLHDVGRVDPRGQTAIEPNRRHPEQSFVIPDQERLAGAVVAPRRSFH
jgi:hypothetical protein